MNFHRTEPNNHYRALRLLSEMGNWELGLSFYNSGTRLRMGIAGRPPSVMDFCLGHDPRIFSLLIIAVLDRLETLPESSSAAAIDALFPWAGTRPDLTLHLKHLLDH
jgi:hypothetical protein